MEQCVCSRILTIYNSTYLCSVCGWSKPIPAGTLVLPSKNTRVSTEENFLNEKKVAINNNVNPINYHKCKTCNKVTKHF
jgi:hypothetical protein